jgi:hypothetical protein
MIENYDPSCVYHIFEISDNSQKIKIAEIENGLFFDVDNKGKRIGNGFRFTNNYAFWRQFNKISIKKIDRPLDGFESIAWGAYWTLSAIITIMLVIIADGINNQIFWLVTSGIHFFLTIRFRHNKFVTYWMLASSIIALLIVYSAGKGKKRAF